MKGVGWGGTHVGFGEGKLLGLSVGTHVGFGEGRLLGLKVG